ncbi:inactive serine protease 54 [Ctenodactylus gundi]
MAASRASPSLRKIVRVRAGAAAAGLDGDSFSRARRRVRPEQSIRERLPLSRQKQSTKPEAVVQGTRGARWVRRKFSSFAAATVSTAALRMAERRALMLSVLLYMSGSSASCGIQKTSLVDESEENLAGSAEFPWVVSVQDSQYTHLAFGCILSPFWILSIASAFQDRPEALVLVGIANMDPNRNAYIEYPVSTIILHEDFDNHSMSNNIALLRTDSAMDFDDLVRSICFLGKSQHKLPALRNCWVSGWNPTSATGNHMTMSILRRISVKDLDLCLLDKHQPLGCGSHTERETDAVCLGEPGSPMMCQLQQLDLWVLQGLLTQGGETCPGLFLYTKVEDYSDWITAQARRAGLPLSALHHWEKLFHFPHHESRAAVTGAVHAKMGHTVLGSRGQTAKTLTTGPGGDDQPDYRAGDTRSAGKSEKT